MKRIYNYIMLLAVALAFAGCADDEIVNIKDQAQTGDEVKFGLSLESLSRTVYGDENIVKDDNGNVTARSYPIYWVDGDKVLIFSPDCLEGRKGAEYKVVLPDEVNAYYAKDLVKTGANGVQWGDEETATFYSLYPSGLYGLSNDGTVAKGIFINYNQNILVDGTSIKSDMEDCLMYAKTTANKGDVVNLQYNPIATVFMLTLNADTDSAEDFVIQSVSIQSADEKTYLAGSFGIKVDDATFAEWGDNKDNIVSAAIKDKATGGYFTLQKGNSIQIPLFMAPVSGLNTNGWKIEVKTLVNGVPQTFIKTLDGLDVLAGKIHKVILPKLSIKKEEIKDWDPATWMVNIPRNVYLSEVSIPGSWNSINNDFQTMGDTDAKTIENQYKKGVRAFHLDTRWKAKYYDFIASEAGTFKEVIGLGVADGGATGSSWSGTVTDGDKYMKGSGTPLVEDIVSQLVGYIKQTPDEYMVLICSFAQQSVQHNGANGWIKEIASICAKDEYKNYILNAQNVTSSTLVGDALGKIVVLIASSEEITSTTIPSSTLAENSTCFFSHLPMELNSNQFGENASNSDELWYTTTTTTNDSGITLYNSHAQLTSSTGSPITDHERGYVPSDSQREAVLNKITNWSRENYGKDDYKHDQWIYLGLGGGYVASGGGTGITSGSYSTIASKYNTWINGKVTEMGTKPEGASAKVPFYPVGIVMMNHVENQTYGAPVVKNILQLNSKYQLQYDPGKSPDYNPNLLPASEYNTVMLNGGAVFQ